MSFRRAASRMVLPSSTDIFLPFMVILIISIYPPLVFHKACTVRLFFVPCLPVTASMASRLLHLFYRLELARFEAGAAFDAEVLVEDVRFLLFPRDGARGADPRAGSATLAGFRDDAVRQEVLAHARGAALVTNMRFVFVAVIPDRAQNGIGRRLTQAAERRGLHIAAQGLEEVDVALLAPPFGDPGEDLEKPLGPDPAR